MLAQLWESLGVGPTICLAGAAKHGTSVSAPPWEGGLAKGYKGGWDAGDQ